MFTYGYIREATMAHLDLDEAEVGAMNLLNRFPIFANEAIQAISSCKPKLKYFQPTIVNELPPVVLEYNDDGDVTVRKPTDDENYFFKYSQWPSGHLPVDEEAPDFGDEIEQKLFYAGLHTYLVNSEIVMDEDFIAFLDKQCFRKDDYKYSSGEYLPSRPKKDFFYTGTNSINFMKTGQYKIPYKATWLTFQTGMSDYDELDIPFDVMVCIPLYIASVALQIDYAQKAQLKRSEFEIALSRVTVSDFMPSTKITPTFRW